MLMPLSKCKCFLFSQYKKLVRSKLKIPTTPMINARIKKPNPLRYLVIAYMPFRRIVFVTFACFSILSTSYLKQGIVDWSMRFSCSVHYGKDYKCLTDASLKYFFKGKLIRVLKRTEK